MYTQEFKVGDIWKWVNREKEFEVIEVDNDGDAWTEYDSCVGRDRILRGELVLIYRDGLSVAATPKTFTKADLVVGKHVVENGQGDKMLFLGNFHGVNTWEFLENFEDDLSNEFEELNIIKVYEMGELVGDLGSCINSAILIWERENAELKAKLTELEQKKLEIEAEIAKLKEGL